MITSRNHADRLADPHARLMMDEVGASFLRAVSARMQTQDMALIGAP